MAPKLRWYPILVLGSFVAEEPNGTILVAPMLTDGTRSTSEDETVALDEDTRACDPALDKQTRRLLLAGKVSDVFRSVLRRDLTEAELLEIDARNKAEPEGSSVCHSHDFCDANVAMAEAFLLVFGRQFDHENDDDTDLFNSAWNQATADGFSSLAPSDDDFVLLGRVAGNADMGVADEKDANALRLLADRLRSKLIAPQPLKPPAQPEG